MTIWGEKKKERRRRRKKRMHCEFFWLVYIDTNTCSSMNIFLLHLVNRQREDEQERKKNLNSITWIDEKTIFWHCQLRTEIRYCCCCSSSRCRFFSCLPFLFVSIFFSPLILIDKHATDISGLSSFSNQVHICGKNGIRTRSRLDLIISLWDMVFFFVFSLSLFVLLCFSQGQWFSSR